MKPPPTPFGRSLYHNVHCPLFSCVINILPSPPHHTKLTRPTPFSPPTVERSQESEQVAKNKRRAQVRKAQVQHRQRKANYVKQLEDSIAGIRDDIAQAEGQRQALRGENEAIRARLSGPAAPPPPPPPSYLMPVLDGGEVPMQDFRCVDPGLDLDYYFPAPVVDPNLNDYVDITATAFDAPDLFSCTDSGAGSSALDSPLFMGSSGTNSPYPYIPDMAPDQPQQAMNLFLA